MALLRPMSLAKDKPNIGILTNLQLPTAFETRYDHHCPTAIREWGGAPVSLDYGAPELAPLYEGPSWEDRQKSDCGPWPLKEHIRKMVEIKKLDGIFIPGNYYDLLPGGDINPDSRRTQFTMALLDVAEELGLPVLGVCGGLQAVVYHAFKDEAQRLNSLKKTTEYASIRHLLENAEASPYPSLKMVEKGYASELAEDLAEHAVHEMRVLPEVEKGTDTVIRWLAKYAHAPEDKTMKMMISSAHTWAVNPDAENIRALKEKGFTVCARAGARGDELSAPEILRSEDKRVLLFQGHPEVMLKQPSPYSYLMRYTFIERAFQHRLEEQKKADISR